MRPSTLLLCLAAVASASWWDDFSNNLASDLAPILALFGEQVTKQFLSESTTRLDTFIFAMVPLGILTAVVSALRVCGGPSLRAFIGRAQEGSGVAEAELCSSTSRDVCELYHNGAVVRVFGRPKIAEIVHDARGASFYEDGENTVAGKAGIYSFQNYIEGTVAANSGWLENDLPVGEHPKDRLLFRQWKKILERFHIRRPGGDGSSLNFAPNPNLSLNYGIKKHSPFVSWGAAFMGFALQASILWFGGLATYRWRWKKNDAYAPDWAFPIMAFGTVLQCVGMYWCAYLIEVSTKERVFRRRQAMRDPSSSALFVVQPGNQVVGDQTFDSFSYSDVGDPIKEYITSWKDPLQEAAPKTAAASVAVTMVGFVLQFVGLRAMHSAVSVFQLGAILMMSLIRSMLRTQRLAREQNLLYNRPDQVQGHELDWLALQIDETQMPFQESSKSSANDTDSTASSDLNAEQPSAHSIKLIEAAEAGCDATVHVCGITYSGPAAASSNVEKAIKAKHITWLKENECPKGSEIPHYGARLFYYRARLSRLTSQSLVSSGLSNAWGEDLVKARSQARLLKNAIEASATIIFSRANIKSGWKNARLFTWSFSTLPWCPGSIEAPQGSRIHLSLTRSSVTENKSSSWHIDQSSMEAVVGLCAWSIQSDPVTEEKDGFGNTVSRAAEVATERILAVTDRQENLKQIETELKFWTENFPEATFHKILSPSRSPEKTKSVGKTSTSNTLWERLDLSNEQFTPAVPSLLSQSVALWRFVRFSGWRNLVSFTPPPTARSPAFTSSLHLPPTLAPHTFTPRTSQLPATPIFGGAKLFALTTGTGLRSPAAFCAHEVYHSFISAATSAIASIGGKLTISSGGEGLFLDNDVISKLVDCFEDSGLGSRQDGYLILVSTLRSRAMLKFSRETLSDIMSIAETHKRATEYEKAEEILQWAWDASNHMHIDTSNGPVTADRDAIMLELGELYRLTMFSATESARKFSQKGVSWMRLVKEDTQALISPATREIIDRYLELSVRDTCDSVPSSEGVIQAISNKDRIQTLWLLSQEGIQLQTADSDDRTVLSWASQQGWEEVVKAALDIGSNVDAGDNGGRTALSYAAESGHVEIMQILMNHQALPILEDNSRRPPLSYAAATGSGAAVDMLLRDRRVTAETRDVDGRSPLYLAAHIGATEAVKLLLKRTGKTIDEASKGITPLVAALKNKHQETAQVLIDHGANWDLRIEGFGPWTWASQSGNWISAEFILRQKNLQEAKEANHGNNGNTGNSDNHDNSDNKGNNGNDNEAKAAKTSPSRILKTAISIELTPGKSYLTRSSRSEYEEEVARVERRSECLALRGGLTLRQFDAEDKEVAITTETAEMLLAEKLSVSGYKVIVENGQVEVSSLGFTPPLSAFPLIARQVGESFYITEKMWLTVVDGSTIPHESTLNMLLECGGDCIEITERVVDAVVKQDEASCMKLLLDRRVNAVPVSDAILRIIAASGYVNLLRGLRDKADRTIPAELWRAAALYRNAAAGDAQAVQRLLKEGADPNTFSHRGWTPLHAAVYASRTETVRVLLQWPGTQVDARRPGDSSALSEAAYKSLDIAQLLLDAGADPCLADSSGESPMSDMTRRKNWEMVKMMEAYAAPSLL